jgi:hypothetical protein
MLIEIEHTVYCNINIKKVYNGYMSNDLLLILNSNTEIKEWKNDERQISTNINIEKYNYIYTEKLEDICCKTIQKTPEYNRTNLILNSSTLILNFNMANNIKIQNQIIIKKNECAYNSKIEYELNTDYYYIQYIINKIINKIFLNITIDFCEKISNY